MVAHRAIVHPDPGMQRIDRHVSPEDVSKLDDRARLFRLVQVIQARDLLTFEHSRRVAHYARSLSRALGHNRDVAQQYWQLGMIHDVGKMWIGEAILNKAGSLTATEFEKVREHAQAGARLITGFDLPEFYAPAVHHHHEMFDGSGYPAGLAGTTIPEAARLLAIVDAFDVITSERPYKLAATLDVAMNEIMRGAGTQFDPDMVQIFVCLTANNSHFIIPARLCAVKTNTARYQIVTGF